MCVFAEFKTILYLVHEFPEPGYDTNAIARKFVSCQCHLRKKQYFSSFFLHWQNWLFWWADKSICWPNQIQGVPKKTLLKEKLNTSLRGVFFGTPGIGHKGRTDLTWTFLLILFLLLNIKTYSKWKFVSNSVLQGNSKGWAT